MADILVNHPCFGSLWLSNCRIVRHGDMECVIGDFWDRSDVGSPHLPDDYRGQMATMNFPLSCVRKDPDGLLTTHSSRGPNAKHDKRTSDMSNG